MAIFRFDPESHRLPTDSRDYETLQQALNEIVPGRYLAAEIGTRAGGSAQMIMENIGRLSPESVFVVIDSYGGMPQAHADGVTQILDYTNKMRNRAVGALYMIAEHVGINMFFANLRDSEFFKRFKDGVPVYDNSEAELLTEYNFIFLDGPHATDLVLKEVEFFSPRCISGAIMVFDDIPNFKMDVIEEWLFSNEWSLLCKSLNKAAYKKN